MENFEQNRFEEGNSLRDYLLLLRQYLTPIIIITSVALIVAVVYAITSKNIYSSTTSLKVQKPSGSILDAPLIPEFQDFGSDRFIANEIEVLKSYTIRERVAKYITNYFYTINQPDSFYIIIDESFIAGEQDTSKIYPIFELADMFEKKITIEQKRGLDIVEISVESQAPYEAALLANLYAKAYKEINLDYSREQLVLVREFLENQRVNMQTALKDAENKLKTFQEDKGIIELSEQAKALIEQITDMQTKVNEAKLNLTISEKSIVILKQQLAEQDPKLQAYLDNFGNEVYVKTLQEQIARLEVQKDVAISSKQNDQNVSQILKDYDQKINELKAKLDKKISVFKQSIFASSPEEVKGFTQKLIEEEVKYQGLKASASELQNLLNKLERQFNELPSSSIEIARLERERLANEKLFLLVEEKYQEAQINEQATPGNVLIIDEARRATEPSKPNRKLIVLIGLVLGFAFGFGYAFIRNFFDNTIKTPEDIQKKNINVLAWIPEIEGLDEKNKGFEFIVYKKPDSIPAEAFRALRTRLHFSKMANDKIKTILVTSAAPKEGKTTVAVNLAATISLAHNKTIILDLDLRKPRMHHMFETQKTPGVTDYLFGDIELEKVIRKSHFENLYYIPAGTIPPNPSEVLASEQLEMLISKLKEQFDTIVLDSPPIVAVTDAEILSRIADATILVVAANLTEVDLMQKAAELLSNNSGSFVGVLLNRFNYRNGYGSYYKYYYYYSRKEVNKKKELKS